MKSMTDFIMEQEAPQVVEEAFNENELVSDFMGVCAASANVACVLECASIVEFCTANEIAVPSIIQESWADFWGAIKNFFKKIADWFKSLVKGTTAVFAKAKITELIAKLKTFDQNEPVKKNALEIARLQIAGSMIIGVLEGFRTTIFEKIMDAKADSKKDLDDSIATDPKDPTKNIEGPGLNKPLYDALETAEEWVAATKDINKWFSSNGSISDAGASSIATAMNKIVNNGKTYSVTEIDKEADSLTVGNVVKMLETLNKLNIPTTGEKILKAFKVDADKIDATFTHTEGTGKGAHTVVDKDSKQIQKIVKEAADSVAKMYDKIKQNMVKVTDLAYKDAEVDKDKKKDYEKELELANKDAGRDDLRKGSEVVR